MGTSDPAQHEAGGLRLSGDVLFGVCSGRLKKLQCAVPGDGSGPGTATQEEWSVRLLPDSLFRFIQLGRPA